MSQLPLIYWFSELKNKDSHSVGAKAAILGELVSQDIPVPNGFVLGTQAYFDFLAQSGLHEKISTIVKDIDIYDSASLFSSSKKIQDLIFQASVSDELMEQVKQAYLRLSAKDIHVAVRPSAVTSESSFQVFDGNHISQLNVKGMENLIEAIKQQWTCAFQPRALHFLAEHGQDALRLGVAVIIQRMVESEVSGLLFTEDPLQPTGQHSAIEAVWGLGEPLVEGNLVPDHYQVNNKDWKVVNKEVVRQEWQLVRNPHAKPTAKQSSLKRLPVSVSWQKKAKLTDAQAIKIAKLGIAIAKHLGQPQDIEWVMAHNAIFIVQSRPCSHVPTPDTSMASAEGGSPKPLGTYSDLPPLLSGAGISPGQACGSVFVATRNMSPSLIPPDSVLFIEDDDLMESVPLEKILAIVCDRKLSSSKLFLSPKEKGIPVIVGTINGTKMVKNGETVSVDGTHGFVYEGNVCLIPGKISVRSHHAQATSAASPILGHVHPESVRVKPQAISTATKVYVNLTEPESAVEYATKNVDGVGLLRAEYVIKRLGEHPAHLLQLGKEQAYIEAIYEGIKLVAKEFAPRPVIYRLTDFTSNQFMSLNGGDKFEVSEDNPSIGFRGAYRYIAEPEVFRLELQAIKRVRQYYKNVWVMAPYVRTPDELTSLKQLMSDEGLYRGGSFKLFMMVEVPANVWLLEQFIGVGIDGVTIGSNDLTQLILGIDRRNPRVVAGFDERQEAVQIAMEQVVRGAAKHGIMSSICGQAPTAYPEFTRQLVEWGISSISVSPEAASTTRRVVADAEFELVRQGKIIKYGK